MSSWNKERKGVTLVLISALLIATEAILAKFAYQYQVNVMTTITSRFTIAAVILIICLSFTKHGLKIPRSSYRLMFFLIIIYIVIAAALFKAFELLPASLAIMFLYAYPTITALLSYFINQEKLTPDKILALLISAVGLVMLMWSSWQNINQWGIILALIAALANAFYLIYSAKMLRQVHQLTMIGWLFLTSTIFYLVAGFSTGSLIFDFPSQGWLPLVGLGLIPTAGATLALVYGLKIIGSTRSAIICTLEPPFTAVLAYFIFDEVLTFFQLFGALLILTAVLIPELAKLKLKAEANKSGLAWSKKD